ncbi:MAG: amidohydrolase family protein [Chloroflexi bacterium]|nr:amidohydrolase family protein [Chloroflexota bacterium]
MITDAQVHIYPPDAPAHPWPKQPGRGAAPWTHPDGFSALEMLGAMEAVGVDRAVIVPPVWAGEDNTTALEAAARHPGRFAVMGRFDPYAAGAPDRLERWLEQPGMIGIRMSGRWNTREISARQALGDPEIEWYWEACERLGIPIAVLAGEAVPLLLPVAARHPELCLIIDHSGMRGAHSLDEAFDTIDALRELAKHPNVNMKMGSIPNASAQPYPFRDTHPYIERIYQAFGARRMMWESDFTQLGYRLYADCLRMWIEDVPFLSHEDRVHILGGTAAEVLRWPEPVLR